jgi:two-component system response regulator DegU
MEINIAIADDHRIFRRSLTRLIHDTSDIRVVLEASDGSELLEKLSSFEDDIDIILLDIQMPNMDGLQCLKVLQKQYPNINIIILSQLSSEHYLKQALKNGVHGYFTKDSDPDELLTAIRDVRDGCFYFEGRLRNWIEQIMKDLKSSSEQIEIKLDFSKRELEIIYWSAMELKSKEIAEKLNISFRTVEGHKNSLIKKTGCKTFLGIILLAIDLKMISKELM